MRRGATVSLQVGRIRKEVCPCLRRRRGRVLSEIVDEQRELFGEPQEIIGCALIDSDKLRAQRLGHAITLALPELRNHVLDDLLFSHGNNSALAAAAWRPHFAPTGQVKRIYQVET